MDFVFLFFGFFVLGFCLKLVDSLKVRFSAFVVGGFGGVLMGYLVAFDGFSAVVFSAMVLGNLLAKKIDSLPLKLGFWTVLLIVFLLGVWIPSVEVFLMLLFFAYVDEYFNDVADKQKSLNLLGWILYFRPFMKVGVLLSVLFGVFQPEHLMAFLLFDLGYHIAEKQV